MPETQPSDTTTETAPETPAPAPTDTARPSGPDDAPAAPADPVLPKRLLFRLPMAALVGVAFLVLCESVVAFAGIWFTLLYLIPIGLTYWLVRTRTLIDADTIEVRRAFTRTRIPWDAVASLRVRDRKWVRAVLRGGKEIALPSVHVRQLSALAVISGGRIADPLATRPAEPDAAPSAEPDASPSAEPDVATDTRRSAEEPENPAE